MSKKFLWLIIAVVAILGVYFAFFNKTATTRSDILFEDSYIYHEWEIAGFEYTGNVILVDGSIYSFSFSEKDEYSTTLSEDLKEMNKYILKNAKLETTRVSNDDLAKMIEYAAQIDADKYIEGTIVGADMGSSVIQIYDYETNSKILLKESGDFSSENTSPHAEDLVQLIEKYRYEIHGY
ncbi:MAG: hypothetical protein LBL34_00710 [Clostridiales bacterium]|nr:hypothetical protein [Clostridiales bacterium]